MGKKKKKKHKKESAGEGEEAKKDEAAAGEPGVEKKEEGEAGSAVGEKKEEEEEGSESAKSKTAFKSEIRPEQGKHGSRVPPLHNYTLDLTCLTAEEEKAIREVVDRDEAEWRPIHDHVQLLRDELNICYRGFKGKQIKPQCVRCRKNFGLWRLFIPFVYRGRRCQRCQFKSCKRCTHRQANGRYMCGICVRLREIKHLTGEWMAPPATRLHGSDLIRVSLRDKEKYQMLHASREKKKHDLLSKLNALHGKKKIDTTGIGSFSLWSSDAKDKKKKKKKKKDKKKKKKKDKDNNADDLEVLADTNASFLAAGSRSVVGKDNMRGRSSSSSGTSDTSSDSEDSGGGSCSSGYESSVLNENHSRDVRPDSARCSTEVAKLESSTNRSKQWVTDESLAQPFSSYHYDDDYHPNFGEGSWGEDRDVRFSVDETEDLGEDEHSTEEGRRTRDENYRDLYRYKRGDTAEVKTILSDVEPENTTKKDLKERFIETTLRDNLMFDKTEKGKIRGHVNPVKFGGEERQNNKRHRIKSRGKATHSKAEYEQLRASASQSYTYGIERKWCEKSSQRENVQGRHSQNTACMTSSEERIKNEKTIKDKKSKLTFTEKSKTKTNEKRPMSGRGKETGNTWKFPQSISTGNKQERQYRQSVRKFNKDEFQNVLNKVSTEAIMNEESLMETLNFALSGKSAKKTKDRNPDPSKSKQSSDDLERCGKSKDRIVESGFCRPEIDQSWQGEVRRSKHKSANGNPSRHRKADRTLLKKDKNLIPSSDKVEAKREIKSEKSPVSETTYTISCKKKKSSHRHGVQPPDRETKSHKRLSSYQELFSMAEINDTKGEYFRFAAHLSQNTGAANIETRPRAFCLSQPDCAWLNENARSISPSVSSSTKNIQCRGHEWLRNNSVENNEWAWIPEQPLSSRKMTSKSPRGGRFKKSLLEALNISTFRAKPSAQRKAKFS